MTLRELWKRTQELCSRHGVSGEETPYEWDRAGSSVERNLQGDEDLRRLDEEIGRIHARRAWQEGR